MLSLLSQGKMNSEAATSEGAYYRKHGLSKGRIAGLKNFQKFVAVHQDWFIKQFVKNQQSDKDSNNFKRDIDWGRNRPADYKFYNQTLKYLRDCGVSITLDFKQFLAWRCLTFGAAKMRKVKTVTKPKNVNVTNVNVTAQDAVSIKAYDEAFNNKLQALIKSKAEEAAEKKFKEMFN